MQTNKHPLAAIVWPLILVLSSVLTGCGGLDIDDKEKVNAAKSFIEENKIREAAIELRNALKANPDNAEARYLLGKINLSAGDAATSEKEFRRAGKAGWNEEQVTLGIVRALVNKREFEQAIEQLKIKDSYSDQTRANLYGIHAYALAGLAKTAKARDVLKQGAAIDANAFEVRKSAIQIELVDGDANKASSLLQKALADHPDSMELLLQNALTAIKTGDMVTVNNAYTKIIELEPANFVTIYGYKARLGLARLALMENRHEEAVDVIAQLKKYNSNDPEVNYLQGLLAFKQNDLQQAQTSLLKVLKASPESVPTQLLYGAVRFAQQDMEQAAYYLSKYVSAVPANLDARKLLARTYIKLGQHEDASKLLGDDIDMAGDLELLTLASQSRLLAGDVSAGLKGLERAVDSKPGDLSLRSNLARAYISAGDNASAVRQLNHMLAKGDDTQQTAALLISAHVRDGQFEQALSVAHDLKQKYPDSPAVTTLLGSTYAISDNKLKARQYFEVARKQQSGFVPATMMLAHLEELEGNFDKAKSLYKSVADINNKASAALVSLARIAEKQNNTDEMVSWLEQARTQNQQDQVSRILLAEYFLRTHTVSKAEAVIDELLKITPDGTEAQTMRGRLLIQQQRYNEAVSQLGQVVDKAGATAYSRALLGEAYFRLGQQDQARTYLMAALEQQADYAPAIVLLVSLELKARQYNLAHDYANRLMELHPTLPLAHELSGDVYMKQNNAEKARQAYLEAWEIKRTSQLTIKYATALNRLNKKQQAVQVLQSWLREHTDDLPVTQLLASAYQNLGQEREAIAQYEKVLAKQPENTLTLNNLAWLYYRNNNPQALKLAERAYANSPDDPAVQDTYGWILVENDRADKARSMLKSAMEKLPNVAEVKYHYAVALMKSGDESNGQQLLKQLLASKAAFEGRADAEKLVR